MVAKKDLRYRLYKKFCLRKLGTDLMNIQYAFVNYLWFLLALSIHEWGHAWVANWLGDDTPRLEGRLTFNPLAHISFIGTVVIPLSIIFLSPRFAVIGWGLPVSVNPHNFRYKQWGDVLCSIAGPFMNFILGLLLIFLHFGFEHLGESWQHLFLMGVAVNINLFLFNLLPVPPLDGSHILKIIMGMKEVTYALFSEIGIFLLLILVNLPLFNHYFSIAQHGMLNFYWMIGKAFFH
jgi:Zn-dependent protease